MIDVFILLLAILLWFLRSAWLVRLHRVFRNLDNSSDLGRAIAPKDKNGIVLYYTPAINLTSGPTSWGYKPLLREPSSRFR